MRVAVFRGEESVGAIVTKVYADLTPAARKVAEAALLKANPQLEKLRGVKVGTVLRIPDVSDVRTKAGRGMDDPESEVRDTLTQRLGAYAQRLAQRHEAYQTDVKRQSALLKDKDFKKAIRPSPALEALAKELGDRLTAQAKAVAASRKQVEAALEKLKGDLAAR